jgi:hypothetical protein
MTWRPSYISCPTCGNEFYQSEVWKRTCLLCWKQRKGVEAGEARHPPARPLIPGDVLRLLLQLVHPDRHGGSPASVKATQWLLEQRKELRA